MTDYQLVMRAGPNPGKTFTLSNDKIVIGRDAGNDIVINDAELSRQHSQFSKQGNTYAVEDLGSTNGTFVDEKRVDGQVLLAGGEIIRMGDNVTLRFEQETDPDATIASASMAPMGEPAAAKPVAQPVKQAQPQYSGQVAQGPSSKPKKGSRGKIFMLGCAGIVIIGVLLAVVALVWIDSNNLWVDVFGETVANWLAQLLGQ